MSRIAIGESAGNGQWAGTPRIIANELRGTPLATPWQHSPLTAGREYLLAYSWESDLPTKRVVGGGWITESAGGNGAKVIQTPTQPLDAWIEAEVPAETPVFATFGDSLASGVGSAMPVRDSWPSFYARRIGALPIQYTASGDTMKGWSDPDHFKWNRWALLTRPDFAIHAMGFNDIGNGASTWELQARHLATMEILRDRLTDQVVLASITPNSLINDERLRTRRSYNQWLAQRKAPFIPFHAEVSPDDRILKADFDVDGSHLNTDGYRHMASILPSNPMQQAAGGRTDTLSPVSNPPTSAQIEQIFLTRPLGIRTETTTSRSCRIPFSVPQNAHRWRVVIRNINSRANLEYNGQVNLRFVGYGTPSKGASGALTSSFEATLNAIARNTLVRDLAHGWASPWMNDNLAPGQDYMLTLGYQTNGTDVTRSMGTGWMTSYAPGNAELPDDSSALPTTTIPFDIRIEIDSSAVRPSAARPIS
ncbi:SGNH/GDSL hydrolase family protein [Brachybacterium tyrofermentans]|uniref:SGNH/GDSL hydrolase family protein n=1 Tax=Brachybacterium tyrofermentans TaxID=47848 RepID=UPI003FCFA6CB